MTTLTDTHWLVFTDLDGTLLDHHTYSHADADPLLATLAERNIPVVPVTSKTRGELLTLRSELNNQHPFIVENGAAVFIPDGYFSHHSPDSPDIDGFWVHSFSKPRSHWQALLASLSEELQSCYTSFAQAGTQGIVEMTGLSEERAAKANERDFSEPLLWKGSDEQLADFTQQMEAKGATILRGGRFVHVTGQCDKGKALKWLKSQYQINHRAFNYHSIAAGDSHNDVAMLEAADYAVIIRSPVAAPPTVNRTDAILSQKEGPAGWADELSRIMDI